MAYPPIDPRGLERSGNPISTEYGRFRDPQGEISRLLDEMERARRGLSDVSFAPTAEDIALQQRIQESLLTPALARVSGGFGSRGLSGSSLEAVQRATMAGQIGLASQQQLRQGAMQRAEFEQGRNLQLFNSLISSIQQTAATAPVKKKKPGIGGIIGGALGGITGAFLGGPTGAVAGFGVGRGVGSGFDSGTQAEEDPYARFA